MTDITELVASEIADFCAGLSSPGEPETPEEIQCQLMGRILPIIGEGLKLANQRIAELEARTVKLPKPLSVLHRRDFIDAHRAIYAYSEAEVNAALDNADIKWEAK